MKTKFLLFATLLLFAFSSCTNTYYIVRHAEKAKTPKGDPPLTEQGLERAQNLKSILSSEKVDQIYSSEYVRTIQTVEPLAGDKNLKIEFYNPAKQDGFIERLKSTNGTSVISGHSNTIRYIINGLYEKELIPQDLNDQEYGDLFVVKRSRSGKVLSYEKSKF